MDLRDLRVCKDSQDLQVSRVCQEPRELADCLEKREPKVTQAQQEVPVNPDLQE